MRKSIARKLNRFGVSLIKALATIAVTSGAIWLLLHLNFFYVEHIIIEPSGENDFTYIDVKTIQDQLLTYEGKRIFSVSTKEVHQLVIDNNPFVQSAYVSKRIPDSLVVRIVEKDPMAVVREGDINFLEQVCAGPILDTDFVINSDGTIITDCSENMKACVRVPLLVVNRLESNTEVLLNPQRWEALFDLVSSLAFFKYDVVGYGLADGDVVVVSFSDSTRGVFTLEEVETAVGSYGDTREALVLEGKSFKEIDVRFERPVVRVDKYLDWVFE